MVRVLLLALACAACSQAARPDRGGGGGGGTGGGGAGDSEAAGGGAAIRVDGELGACDPSGVWRARASFPGGGDCAELPDALELEVVVSRRPGGTYVVDYAGAGRIAPDRLAARDGVCAIGFTVKDEARSMYLHLVASGKGSGVLTMASCTDAIALAVTRGARSAE